MQRHHFYNLKCLATALKKKKNTICREPQFSSLKNIHLVEKEMFSFRQKGGNSAVGNKGKAKFFSLSSSSFFDLRSS